MKKLTLAAAALAMGLMPLAAPTASASGVEPNSKMLVCKTVKTMVICEWVYPDQY